MIHNNLYRQCLAAVPDEERAAFELSYGIAERISEVMAREGITRKEFATRLRKRETEVAAWLTGRHNFTTRTIARIETALGCKLLSIAR